MQATGTKWFSMSIAGDAKASPWTYYFCIKDVEIWQKINPVAFQLVLGDERDRLWLGLILIIAHSAV